MWAARSAPFRPARYTAVEGGPWCQHPRSGRRSPVGFSALPALRATRGGAARGVLGLPRRFDRRRRGVRAARCAGSSWPRPARAPTGGAAGGPGFSVVFSVGVYDQALRARCTATSSGERWWAACSPVSWPASCSATPPGSRSSTSSWACPPTSGERPAILDHIGSSSSSSSARPATDGPQSRRGAQGGRNAQAERSYRWERERIAQGPLRSALVVGRPRGGRRRVLVVDDVFTEGARSKKWRAACWREGRRKWPGCAGRPEWEERGRGAVNVTAMPAYSKLSVVQVRTAVPASTGAEAGMVVRRRRRFRSVPCGSSSHAEAKAIHTAWQGTISGRPRRGRLRVGRCHVGRHRERVVITAVEQERHFYAQLELDDEGKSVPSGAGHRTGSPWRCGLRGGDRGGRRSADGGGPAARRQPPRRVVVAAEGRWRSLWWRRRRRRWGGVGESRWRRKRSRRPHRRSPTRVRWRFSRRRSFRWRLTPLSRVFRHRSTEPPENDDRKDFSAFRPRRLDWRPPPDGDPSPLAPAGVRACRRPGRRR